VLNLGDRKIILASQSPRRKELLSGLGVAFTVEVPNVDEKYPSSLPPEEVPAFLAGIKADAFREKVGENEIVITADTIVIHEGQILEKPIDRKDAIQMLKKLSGSSHSVVTAVCIMTKDARNVFSDRSEVEFAALEDEEIAFYVDQYKPYDKAGAYGVQDWIGYIGIRRIEGSYFTVMGLPVHRVYEALKRLA